MDGPLVGMEAFEEAKRAIVVAAHADDLETMMGGTTWLLTQRGVEVYELICTLGDLGAQDDRLSREALAEVRRREAQDAGALLGIREVVVLDYHDGELEPGLELRGQIAHYYRLWQPDTLFTFDPSWAGQIHSDHRAAGRAAIDALMPSRMPLYKPEQLQNCAVGRVGQALLFSPATASIYVDVTDLYDKKLAASMAHISQFPEGEKSLEWMRRLDTEAAKGAGLEGRLVEQFARLRLW